MLSLSQIEHDLTTAIKAREQIKVDTLRGLKTRIQNEKISKSRDLEDSELLQLVQSEVKRRKEAADSFSNGGRAEQAEKELLEANILLAYLPAQISPDEIGKKVDELVVIESWTTKDFGKAMAKLKDIFGAGADGATLSKILKEKLK